MYPLLTEAVDEGVFPADNHREAAEEEHRYGNNCIILILKEPLRQRKKMGHKVLQLDGKAGINLRSHSNDWMPGTLRPPVVPPPEDGFPTRVSIDGILRVDMPLILYSDDFKLSQSSNKKIGGICRLFVEIPPEQRTGAQSVRTISAVNGGIYSDVVLEAI